MPAVRAFREGVDRGRTVLFQFGGKFRKPSSVSVKNFPGPSGIPCSLYNFENQFLYFVGAEYAGSTRPSGGRRPGSIPGAPTKY